MKQKIKIYHRFIIFYVLMILLGWVCYFAVFIPYAKNNAAAAVPSFGSIARSGAILLLLADVVSLIIPFGFYRHCYLPLRNALELSYAGLSGNVNYPTRLAESEEFGELQVNLNSMAAKINDSGATQQALLSNVTHDFRSPLTSIKGYTEAIRDGTIPRDELDKYLDIILDMTDRMTRMSNDVLTINKLNGNKIILYVTAFNINDVCEALASAMEFTCRKKHMRLILSLNSSLPAVAADQEKIQQVIYNLVDNAIKFSKPGNDITVSTSRHGKQVLVSVRDHGIGIAPEHLPKIWNRFYKVDTARNPASYGSGLGLSIVKEILDLHHQEISVESEVNSGSTFTFTLDIAEPAPAPK